MEKQIAPSEGSVTFADNINEAITDMLSDIGVQMELVTLPTAEFFPRVTNLDDPIDAFSYEWLWSSPVDVLIIFNTIPSPEYNGKLPELGAAFGQWQTAKSDTDLEAAAKKAQLIWAEKLPKIPLVTRNSVWVHSKKVHNWSPSQTMLYPQYNDVWVEQ